MKIVLVSSQAVFFFSSYLCVLIDLHFFQQKNSQLSRSVQVYPRPDGSVYLCGLGGSDHVHGDRLRAGGDCFDPADITADPTRIDAALRAFRSMSSLGDATPAVTQACMRPLHPDGLPTMGAISPDIDGAFVSAGHNCWGILWAPVAGYAMAQLVCAGRSDIVDLGPFQIGRFMPAQQRRGRKQGNADVGEQW